MVNKEFKELLIILPCITLFVLGIVLISHKEISLKDIVEVHTVQSKEIVAYGKHGPHYRYLIVTDKSVLSAKRHNWQDVKVGDTIRRLSTATFRDGEEMHGWESDIIYTLYGKTMYGTWKVN